MRAEPGWPHHDGSAVRAEMRAEKSALNLAGSIIRTQPHETTARRTRDPRANDPRANKPTATRLASSRANQRGVSAGNRWIPAPSLLFLFVVPGVLTQSRAVLFQLQLFATRFPANRVVVITGLFTHQEDGFRFLFAFCHRIEIPNQSDARTTLLGDWVDNCAIISSAVCQTAPRIRNPSLEGQPVPFPHSPRFSPGRRYTLPLARSSSPL